MRFLRLSCRRSVRLNRRIPCVHSPTMDLDGKREKRRKKKGRAEEKEKGEQTEAGLSPRRPASSLISSLAFSPSFFLFSVFSLSLLYFFSFTFVCLFGRRDSDFSNTARVAILGRVVVGDREERVFPGNRFETWHEKQLEDGFSCHFHFHTNC